MVMGLDVNVITLVDMRNGQTRCLSVFACQRFHIYTSVHVTVYDKFQSVVFSGATIMLDPGSPTKSVISGLWCDKSSGKWMVAISRVGFYDVKLNDLSLSGM